tara:strand:- start:4038 stop:4676 length:639 start_codon:yes stop_codon:yes gene_type:complete
MVRRDTGPGASIVDDSVDTYRDFIKEQRIAYLSVRWGGPGAPFINVYDLYGGMKGYGLALEDDPELQSAPSPGNFSFSAYLKGVRDASEIYPEYSESYANFKVVGYGTEMLLKPYDRDGNLTEFKLHRVASGRNSAFDVGTAFGAAGDFVKVSNPIVDQSNATALGLTPEEYARNFWELTIIKGSEYNKYLEDWDWFDRSQGANSSRFDPPL